MQPSTCTAKAQGWHGKVADAPMVQGTGTGDWLVSPRFLGLSHLYIYIYLGYNVITLFINQLLSGVILQV